MLQSIQRNGVVGTVGGGIVGAVRSAPGIGLVSSLYAPNRDWSNVGAQTLNTAAFGISSTARSTFYKVESGGARGEIPLNLTQRTQVKEYLSKFDLKNVDVRWVDDRNLSTAYGEMYGGRILNIGSDVVPGNIGSGTRSANSRVSINGTLAHEIVGHREAAMAGRTQDLVFLEEAQASIRAARFAPDLTSTERFTLLRDGITRLQRAPEGPVRIGDVKSLLYIERR